jgi:hypothetical protein
VSGGFLFSVFGITRAEKHQHAWVGSERQLTQKFRFMSGVWATQIKNVLEATTYYIQKIAKTYNSMYTLELTRLNTAFLAA